MYDNRDPYWFVRGLVTPSGRVEIQTLPGHWSPEAISIHCDQVAKTWLEGLSGAGEIPSLEQLRRVAEDSFNGWNGTLVPLFAGSLLGL